MDDRNVRIFTEPHGLVSSRHLPLETAIALEESDAYFINKSHALSWVLWACAHSYSPQKAGGFDFDAHPELRRILRWAGSKTVFQVHFCSYMPSYEHLPIFDWSGYRLDIVEEIGRRRAAKACRSRSEEGQMYGTLEHRYNVYREAMRDLGKDFVDFDTWLER